MLPCGTDGRTDGRTDERQTREDNATQPLDAGRLSFAKNTTISVSREGQTARLDETQGRTKKLITSKFYHHISPALTNMNSSHGLAQLSSPSSWSQESIHIPAWDLIPQLDVFVMVSKPYHPLNMLKYRWWLATVYQLNTNPIKSHRNPSIIPQEHLPPKYGGFFLAKIFFHAFMEARLAAIWWHRLDIWDPF